MRTSNQKRLFNIFLYYPAITYSISLQKVFGLFQSFENCDASAAVGVFTRFTDPDWVFKLMFAWDWVEFYIHAWVTFESVRFRYYTQRSLHRDFIKLIHCLYQISFVGQYKVFIYFCIDLISLHFRDYFVFLPLSPEELRGVELGFRCFFDAIQSIEPGSSFHDLPYHSMVVPSTVCIELIFTCSALPLLW